ncbi:MAG: Crp/Fnr family transcriptional regulator [Alphaproteobacteria bacterium]|nr:Crp/Fnr family transcriptional regulator [Alphaproteobacteria bacterium]
MSTREAKLKRVYLFSDVDDEALGRIGELCDWRRYKKGRQIVGEQDLTNVVYILTAGRVRAKRFSTGGKEVSYRDLEEGAIFGEYSAIDARPRSATIVALTDCETAVLGQAEFLALIQEYPGVAMRFIRELVQQVRSLSDRVFEFSTLAVNSRIHAELVRMASAVPPDTDGIRRIKDPPTHLEIANRISTHREAVSRELAYLESGGVIKKSRQVLAVLDIERLRSMISSL